jgi:hypothetical protein
MRKRYGIIIALGILVFSSAGWALYLYNKPHQNVASIRPSVKMDAVGLCAEYQKDEPGADKRYVGKVVEVSGTVIESQVNAKGASIRIGTAQNDAAVSCEMSVENWVTFHMPSNGMKVKIKGRCTGFLQDVNLVDCVIE